MKNLAAFIVPTGIGASIGGFAGDASYFAKQIAKDYTLIVNPNVVNAAVFSGITDNMLYTEGFSLDKFFQNKIALRPSKHNKIGVIFDKRINQKVLNVHINTINAVKTVYGIDIVDYEITNKEVGVEFSITDSGISSGSIKNPQTLINAGKNLIEKGAEAIAIVCHFDEDDNTDYENGIGVDPVGGVEAIISHIISKELKIPTAHAPAFDDITIPIEIVDTRAAAEYITPTFLPCILLGLNNAPKIIDIKDKQENDYSISDLKALITPYNCLGGLPILACEENNIPIIAVKENQTILNVNNSKMHFKNVVEVNDYNQAQDFLTSI